MTDKSERKTSQLIAPSIIRAECTRLWAERREAASKHRLQAFAFQQIQHDASEALAQQVADGLGMKKLPEPLPKAPAHPETSEVTHSALLSLTARPGDGTISARKIAILAATGASGKSAIAAHAAFLALGGVARFLTPRIGPVQTSDGVATNADASTENEHGFLFDALVLKDGEKAVAVLSKDGNTIDFIKNQYRHCNPIMAIGAAKSLLDTAEVSLKLRLSFCLACPTRAKCKNPTCDLMCGRQARTQQKKMACF